MIIFYTNFSHLWGMVCFYGGPSVTILPEGAWAKQASQQKASDSSRPMAHWFRRFKKRFWSIQAAWDTRGIHVWYCMIWRFPEKGNPKSFKPFPFQYRLTRGDLEIPNFKKPPWTQNRFLFSGPWSLQINTESIWTCNILQQSEWVGTCFLKIATQSWS